MSRPTGTIILCANIPFSNTYEHTIDFNSAEEQYNFFFSRKARSFEKYTYLKKDVVQVGANFDDLKAVNYVMYKSRNDSRQRYGFVTNKRYINPNLTELTIEEDVLQTYMFDYTLEKSFVERMHVDRWDLNYKPVFTYTDEGLSYGDEYVTEKAYKIAKEENDVLWFMVLMSASEDIQDTPVLPSSLNDIPTPFFYYLVPHKKGNAKFTFSCNGKTVSNMSAFMSLMCDSAVGKAVREISLIPYLPFNMEVSASGEITLGNGLAVSFENITAKDSWVQNIIETFTGNDDYVFHAMQINASKCTFDITKTLCLFSWDEGLTVPTKEDFQSFKDNPLQEFDKKFESKLLMYPYRYNLLNNWRGGNMVVKNEYLPNIVQVKFTKAFAFNNPSRYWIDGYKSDIKGRNASITDDQSLQLPIISDAYYTYLLENRNQLNANLLGSISNIAMGAIAGGAVGAVASGVASTASNIMGQLAKEKDLKKTPDSIINANDCSLAIGDDNVYLTFYRYRVNDDNMERLAGYFHMYGYKVMKLTTPKTKTRSRFNYIKTIGCNITANIDYDDILKLKNIFDRGVTFWHWSEEYFLPLNYSYENIERGLIESGEE